jgi:hypothetical protein
VGVEATVALSKAVVSVRLGGPRASSMFTLTLNEPADSVSMEWRYWPTPGLTGFRTETYSEPVKVLPGLPYSLSLVVMSGQIAASIRSPIFSDLEVQTGVAWAAATGLEDAMLVTADERLFYANPEEAYPSIRSVNPSVSE